MDGPLTSSRRLVLLALLAAAGVSLSVVESFVPMPLPFLRLGLANISTLLALLVFGFPAAIAVAVVRIVAASVLTGTLFGPAFLLSLSGGLAAACAMGAVAASAGRLFGAVGISLVGSAAHVTGQLVVVAMLFVGSAAVWSLLPVLLASAFVGGLVVGLISARALPLIMVEKTLTANQDSGGSQADLRGPEGPKRIVIPPAGPGRTPPPPAGPGRTLPPLAGQELRLPPLSGPKRKLLPAADFLLIGAYILAIVASGVYAARVPAEGSTAVVTVEGRPLVKLDLLEAESLTVRGAPGEVTVEVKEGGVRVTSAECPNKVCVRTGRISRAGDVILCAPNRVLIRIAGKGGAGPRAVTG